MLASIIKAVSKPDGAHRQLVRATHTPSPSSAAPQQPNDGSESNRFIEGLESFRRNFLNWGNDNGDDEVKSSGTSGLQFAVCGVRHQHSAYRPGEHANAWRSLERPRLVGEDVEEEVPAEAPTAAAAAGGAGRRASVIANAAVTRLQAAVLGKKSSSNDAVAAASEADNGGESAVTEELSVHPSRKSSVRPGAVASNVIQAGRAAGGVAVQAGRQSAAAAAQAGRHSVQAVGTGVRHVRQTSIQAGRQFRELRRSATTSASAAEAMAGGAAAIDGDSKSCPPSEFGVSGELLFSSGLQVLSSLPHLIQLHIGHASQFKQYDKRQKAGSGNGISGSASKRVSFGEADDSVQSSGLLLTLTPGSEDALTSVDCCTPGLLLRARMSVEGGKSSAFEWSEWSVPTELMPVEGENPLEVLKDLFDEFGDKFEEFKDDFGNFFAGKDQGSGKGQQDESGKAEDAGVTAEASTNKRRASVGLPWGGRRGSRASATSGHNPEMEAIRNRSSKLLELAAVASQMESDLSGVDAVAAHSETTLALPLPTALRTPERGDAVWLRLRRRVNASGSLLVQLVAHVLINRTGLHLALRFHDEPAVLQNRVAHTVWEAQAADSDPFRTLHLHHQQQHGR